MGLFSFLKIAPKTVDDVFDKEKGHLAKFGEWIGNQQFTPEEKAEFTHKFVIDTLSENTDRSKARRHISVLVMKFYLVILGLSILVYPFHIEWSKMIFKVATSGGIIGLVSAISLFFFGTHALRSTKYGTADKE